MSDSIILIFLLGCAIFLLVWFTVLIYQTFTKKGDLGINLDRVNCPKCKAEMPQVRTPNSIRQFLFGGWNCPNCGCEIDKWGNEIPNIAVMKNSSKQIEEAKEKFIKSFDKKGKTPVEKIFEENQK